MFELGGKLESEAGDPIAFLSFRLDRRAGRLTCAAKSIPLRPKTWAVLLYLAERPGALVTQEELLDAVWSDVAITPDTLRKSIGELRVVLGDDSKRPRVIETVHRRGFRFIAAIDGQPAVAPSDDPQWETREARQGTQPFVGRAAEIQRLAALFGRACGGERQTVFVTGPTGVGKTTLVDGFLDSPVVREAASPVWVARGSCVEQLGMHEAYMPVLDALERLSRRPDSEQFLGLLRRIAPTWLAQMPWLADDAPAVRKSLHAGRPERMLREFAVLADSLTSDRALILVLEDLHWSDASTVDLLSFLAERREPARLLVIGTYRPAEVAVHGHPLSRIVRTLQLHRRCTDLPVHELTSEDVRRYLEERFPGAGFATALAPMLHRYTDGNPLFVVTFVDHMLSRGWILDTDPGWVLSTSPEELPLEIPDDAQRVIEMQFESLSPADRELVEAASAGGAQFNAEALAAALCHTVEETEKRCEELARTQRFLRVAGSVESLADGRARHYAFSHELYRHAAYAGIPERQRQRFHQRIGEALETAHGERAAELAPELAVHFERAHDWARAVNYLVAAAARARQRFAWLEAIRCLESAITLAARLPADERRRRELELRLALWPLLKGTHGYASEKLGANSERAHELCVEVGTSEQLFQTLYALCHVHGLRADKVRTPALAAELDDLAARLATNEHRQLADTILARFALMQGRYRQTCRIAEGLTARDDRGQADSQSRDLVDALIDTRSHHALAIWFLGHGERAKAVMAAALVEAKARGSALAQASVLGHAALLALFGQEQESACELARSLAALTEEQGFGFYGAMAAAVGGSVRVRRGELTAGIEQLERAEIALRQTGSVVFSSHILAFLAEAHLRAGNLTAGLAAADEGLAIAESTLDHSYWPELWRIKGELLLAAAPRTRLAPKDKASSGPLDSRWPDAERCLLRAHEVARECESKSLELRAAVSLARAWCTRRRNLRARALLAETCRWFEGQAETPDLAEARALLDRLSA